MSNKELIAKYREGYKKGFLDGAEPEQTEQEPVGIVKTIGGYPDNSQHTVVLTCRHGDLKDGDLLYKAPPNREPLSEDESAPYDMSIHSNPSALAWTTFFREHNPDCNVDDDAMLAWFANAMMAMHDHIYQSTQPEQTEHRLKSMRGV